MINKGELRGTVVRVTPPSINPWTPQIRVEIDKAMESVWVEVGVAWERIQGAEGVKVGTQGRVVDGPDGMRTFVPTTTSSRRVVRSRPVERIGVRRVSRSRA